MMVSHFRIRSSNLFLSSACSFEYVGMLWYTAVVSSLVLVPTRMQEYGEVDFEPTHVS